MSIKPCALVILDGFGYRKESEHNAIAQAHTPCLDMLLKQYPHTLLRASGTSVGLPEGYVGNSEVGHMAIGCGQVIQQSVTRLNKEIEQDTLKNNQTFKKDFPILVSTNGRLHIMGLLSDAGVHAHIDHMVACAKIAEQYGIKTIWLHLFLDGRDSPPQSALLYIEQLKSALKNSSNVRIGSITGRFFTMDRDNNWDRTCKTVDMLINRTTKVDTNTPENSIDMYAQENIFDEFIPPTLFSKDAQITTNDGILCVNFRPDRIRQLTAALTNTTKKLCNSAMPKLSFFISPVSYGNGVKTDVLLPRPAIKNSLKQMLARNNKTMFTIAETEKYAHVTYFFSGGYEDAFPGETRVLVPSLSVENYGEHSCMSASEITKQVLDSLKKDPKDFYLINYANADMVGHSGNFKATVKAIECLDEQIKKLYEQIVVRMNGTLFITSDHGNAEQMYDIKNKQPHTAHTTNPVPFIAVGKNVNQNKVAQLYELGDIAPFLLTVISS